MAKKKIRLAGNRSGGGRPRKEGPRENGRLKIEPNAKVLAARAALGVGDAGSRMGPVRFAYSKGWLTAAEVVIADVYIDAYSHAGLGGPGYSAQRDLSIAAGAADELRVNWSALDNAQVAAMGWNAFSDKEIAAIWDSALRPEAQQSGGSSALRRWKAMSGSMSSLERTEVDAVLLHDSWPQWILQRNSGRMDTSWEGKRQLLVSGLHKMGRAIKQLKAANDDQPRSGDRAA